MSDLPPPGQTYRATAILYAGPLAADRARRGALRRRSRQGRDRRGGVLRRRDGLELVPLPTARATSSAARARRLPAERPAVSAALVEELVGDLGAIRAPRGTHAPRRLVADRGAASDAPQQPRPRGRGASRVARRLRRLGARRAVARRASRHRAHAPSATGRRDAPRPVGQARRRLPDARGRAARPDRQLAPRARVGDVGRVPPPRGRGADDVRPDDRRVVDLHRHAGNPARDVPDVLRGGRDALRLARSRGTDGAHGGSRRHGWRAAARGDDGRRSDPLRRGRPAVDRSPARDAVPRRAGRRPRRRARARARCGCRSAPAVGCRPRERGGRAS